MAAPQGQTVAVADPETQTTGGAVVNRSVYFNGKMVAEHEARGPDCTPC